MALEHLKHHSNGQTLKVMETGQDTGQRVYKAFSGQKNVDLGGDVFAPYVWDEPSQSIRYGSHVCEFYADGYQIVREYGSVETLIDDQRFELQYWQDPPGRWRVLDLWQIGLTVNQQDDYCVVTRNLSDGEGNTLDVDFLFQPMEKVKLTFRLHVVDANLYRIRFQNTGIAGEVIEIPYIDRTSQNNLGICKLLFSNMWFAWDADEIGIHEGYTIEDQAGGKKLDLFLGDFDLPDNGDVIVSPDTWGPVTTSDDCYQYGSAYYDDTAGEIFAGVYTGATESMGLTFSNVAVPNGVTIDDGTKITVTASSLTGTISGCLLKVCDSRDVGAWSGGNLPADQAVHSTTVGWDLNESSGSHDSPEFKAPVGERISDDHVSGDPMSVVLISPMDSGTEEQGITADDAELTIVYTPAVTIKTVYDTGAGIDGLPGNLASLGIPDAGASADGLPGSLASLGIPDVGVGADGLPGHLASVGIPDVGAGADGLPGGLASLGIPDVGAGLDADLGEEEYDTIFDNRGFETFITDGLDITSAINTFLGGVCSYNIALNGAKLYEITFDYTHVSGTYPYYRFAADNNLATATILNEQMTGTGSYTFYSLGAAYHGFTNPTFPPCSFAVANLSVKEAVPSLSIAASLGIADTVSGAEAIELLAAMLKLVSDTGAGTDALAQILSSLNITDVGAGTDDLAQILNSLNITDVGAGADDLAQILNALQISDTGVGADLAGISVNFSISDTGSGADAIEILAAALKLVSDLASGSDAISNISVSLNVPDVATGADTSTITVSLDIADTGAGADALAQILNSLQISDTGVGSDDFSGQVSVGIPDAGAGVDQTGISVNFSVSDTGAGTDALNVYILKFISDLASGSDVISSLSVNLGLPDAGSGSDALGITVSLVLSDTGAGVDVVNVLAAALKLISDSGTGSDVVSSVTVVIPVADTGAGADQAGISASLPVADTGSGVDASSISVNLSALDTADGSDGVPTIAVSLTVSDTGVGTEVATVLAAALKVISDSGLGSDAVGISVTVPVVDTGAGVDAVTVIVEIILKTVSDFGAGTDQVSSISVNVPVIDTATGTDLISSITALLQVADLGEPGVDVITRILGDKIVTIEISLKKRSVIFGLKKRSIDFALEKRGTDFSLN